MRIAILLFTALSLTACDGKTSAVEPAAVTQGALRSVDAKQLKADLDAGKVALLLDVRTPGEYAEGHVPGTVLIPVDDVTPTHSGITPHKGDEIYLICRSGSRSMRAAKTLQAAGYTVVNVDGGTLGWVDAGFPVDN
jgi:rhodanese-related sulfurtransferase